ncbi:MAG TPA: isoprenylcysteine carboxylmethyltransferase family protein [Anaerolineae bacterium]|nr:isoprenylcysteine carboxylmethyltransferase family protein [Anaerolineae bacterium]HNU05874.1 isoprenylcysteine carboxylmethyltransferase family protein [Anaerolineae bacterium]
MANQARMLTPRVLIITFVFVVVAPFLPLLISQRWNWWQAWVYAIVSIAAFVISRALAARRNPDLLAERSRFLQHADAKPWDKKLAPLVGLGGALIPLVAGLDARFGQPAGFSLAVELAALAVLLAGYALASYALIENAWFSGMVRLQTDRGQQVISSGPYRWVRHPGYAGALLAYLATPLLLASPWALLPALFLAGVVIVRTRLEDQTLQAELPGYAAYAQRVRRRLAPGIW